MAVRMHFPDEGAGGKCPLADRFGVKFGQVAVVLKWHTFKMVTEIEKEHDNDD